MKKHSLRLTASISTLVVTLAVCLQLLLPVAARAATVSSAKFTSLTAHTKPTQLKPYIPPGIHSISVKQIGYLFVVTYFSPTTTTKEDTSSTKKTLIPNDIGCFPDNAIWTWSNIVEFLQAWIGPQETDSYGLHNNLHVQAFCGSDYHNYHIRYNGESFDENGDDYYVWEVYDSTTGETKLYEAWTGLGESDAADTAASAFAGDVGQASAEDLGQALLDILPEVFLGLLLAA